MVPSLNKNKNRTFGVKCKNVLEKCAPLWQTGSWKTGLKSNGDKAPPFF
jgi:hypothetical protein